MKLNLSDNETSCGEGEEIACHSASDSFDGSDSANDICDRGDSLTSVAGSCVTEGGTDSDKKYYIYLGS